MKSSIFFFALLLLVGACSDNEEINYAGTYVSTSVKASSAKMYTHKGEVKKRNSILNFLPDDIETDFFIFADPPAVGGVLAVEFLDNDSVAVTENGRVEKKILTRKNGILYLESLQSGTIFGGGNVGGLTLAKLLKYKPLYTDTAYVSSWPNDTYIVEVKECMYLEPSGDQLHLPLLCYYYKNSYVSGGYSTYAARLNNSFRDKALQLLSPTDTLVIQQLYIVLKKQ